MIEIDRLLPKPMEEMTLTDVLKLMDETQSALGAWLASRPRGVKQPKLNPDHILAAYQCLLWGCGLIEEIKGRPDVPEYNVDEAVFFIRCRTDLTDEVIRKVLDAEEGYMVDKGIISDDPDFPDIPTPPGVQ